VCQQGFVSDQLVSMEPFISSRVFRSRVVALVFCPFAPVIFLQHQLKGIHCLQQFLFKCWIIDLFALRREGKEKLILDIKFGDEPFFTPFAFADIIQLVTQDLSIAQRFGRQWILHEGDIKDSIAIDFGQDHLGGQFFGGTKFTEGLNADGIDGNPKLIATGRNGFEINFVQMSLEWFVAGIKIRRWLKLVRKLVRRFDVERRGRRGGGRVIGASRETAPRA